MKSLNTLFLVPALALICVTSAVSAEEPLTGPSSYAANKPLNYVLLKTGIYSPSGDFVLNNFNNGQARTDLNSKSGFAGEVAVGRYFTPMLAAEIGAGYFESDGYPSGQGDTKIRVVPLTATGKFLFPVGMFEPYGLAGLGAYISDLNVAGNTGNFRGGTEINIGVHAGAGFNVNFHNNMMVGLEGKYLWAEPSFGGQDVKLNGFVTTATLGFRY